MMARLRRSCDSWCRTTGGGEGTGHRGSSSSAIARNAASRSSAPVLPTGRRVWPGPGSRPSRIEQHLVAAAGLLHDVAGDRAGCARRRPGPRTAATDRVGSTGSRPTVGSSSSSTSGSARRATARDTRGALPTGQVTGEPGCEVVEPDVDERLRDSCRRRRPVGESPRSSPRSAARSDPDTPSWPGSCRPRGRGCAGLPACRADRGHLTAVDFLDARQGPDQRRLSRATRDPAAR